MAKIKKDLRSLSALFAQRYVLGANHGDVENMSCLKAESCGPFSTSGLPTQLRI